MEILEIILLVIIFIWLIDLSYSRSKTLKYIEKITQSIVGDLKELENRIEQLKNKLEEKFSDSDFDADN